ncbi:MAG TPA: dihydroneopterin aldolase [Candidatus Peribacterales bacterium]|nr:dihydroneopterin aldolase [Candidatus Peribacterales bacterium]
MEIRISALELWTHIGIPDFERLTEQRILATIRIFVKEAVSMNDSLVDTVDYAAVIDMVKKCGRRDHKTVEKLAEDIADTILTFKHAKSVEVSLTKHIMPGTGGITITLCKP